MQSRHRILAALNGQPHDHVPLTTWCFGFKPAPSLRWRRESGERTYWYSLRMEHIHTLPQPWTLEDDFARVLAWQSLGVDDILDVSVPWSCHPEVTWTDLSSRQRARMPARSRSAPTPPLPENCGMPSASPAKNLAPAGWSSLGRYPSSKITTSRAA